MDMQTAVNIIKDLTNVTTNIVHEENSKRGVSKKSMAREKRAIIAVFQGLTGSEPTSEQLADISNW